MSTIALWPQRVLTACSFSHPGTEMRLQFGVGVQGSLAFQFGSGLGVSQTTGDGTFTAGTSYATDSYISAAVSLTDVNGDGRQDLITAGEGDGIGGTATVRINNGAGGFNGATSYTAESDHTHALTMGDVNGDGKPDMITAGSNVGPDGFATVRFNNGDGTFGSATQYATEGYGSMQSPWVT